MVPTIGNRSVDGQGAMTLTMTDSMSKTEWHSSGLSFIRCGREEYNLITCANELFHASRWRRRDPPIFTKWNKAHVLVCYRPVDSTCYWPETAGRELGGVTFLCLSITPNTTRAN